MTKKSNAQAISYFCAIIDTVDQKGDFHNRLLLKWLLGEHLLFRYGLHVLSEGTIVGDINHFYNGYYFLKENNTWEQYYDKQKWVEISNLIAHRYNFKSLGLSLFKGITNF